MSFNRSETNKPCTVVLKTSQTISEEIGATGDRFVYYNRVDEGFDRSRFSAVSVVGDPVVLSTFGRDDKTKASEINTSTFIIPAIR